MIYLLTAIGLSPGGRSTVHIYTQTIHRTIQNKQYTEQHNNLKSADRAPSWRVIPWHLPYNRGKTLLEILHQNTLLLSSQLYFLLTLVSAKKLSPNPAWASFTTTSLIKHKQLYH